VIEGPLRRDQLVREWERIVPVLAPAVRLDPKRTILDVLGHALRQDMAFWRVSGEANGYLVTQITGKRTFWVIYAAGVSGGVAMMRGLMAEIEHIARHSHCAEVRFEGRDWRKILPDYRARKGADGRWHFRKALAR
jgi:hypothetical protein